MVLPQFHAVEEAVKNYGGAADAQWAFCKRAAKTNAAIADAKEGVRHFLKSAGLKEETLTSDERKLLAKFAEWDRKEAMFDRRCLAPSYIRSCQHRAYLIGGYDYDYCNNCDDDGPRCPFCAPRWEV